MLYYLYRNYTQVHAAERNYLRYTKENSFFYWIFINYTGINFEKLRLWKRDYCSQVWMKIKIQSTANHKNTHHFGVASYKKNEDILLAIWYMSTAIFDCGKPSQKI